MSKFIYLYRGPARPMSDFTEEESAEQMKAWGEWMGGSARPSWTAARRSAVGPR